MKTVQYFWTEGGTLFPIEESDELIQNTPWWREETLKIELWPFDMKVGTTRIPLNKTYEKQNRVEEITRRTSEYRRDKDARPNQIPLIRVDETGTPYSSEFTKRDDARSRAHLSKEISRGRKNSKESPPQADAPF